MPGRDHVIAYSVTAARKAEVMRKLQEEGLHLSVLLECVVDGFMNNHPAVMAMVDDYRRSVSAVVDATRPRLTERDLDGIYGEFEDRLEDDDVEV